MAGTCFLGQNTCLKKIQETKYTNNPHKTNIQTGDHLVSLYSGHFF